jgi:hypothetical protein
VITLQAYGKTFVITRGSDMGVGASLCMYNVTENYLTKISLRQKKIGPPSINLSEPEGENESVLRVLLTYY